MQVITVCLLLLFGVFSASLNSGDSDSNSNTNSSSGALSFSSGESNFNEDNSGENSEYNFVEIFQDEEESDSVQPVPEPATFLLLGPALLGLMGLRRKK